MHFTAKIVGKMNYRNYLEHIYIVIEFEKGNYNSYFINVFMFNIVFVFIVKIVFKFKTNV